MMLRIGQKVVCINDVGGGRRLNANEIYPVKGTVYTIRGFKDKDALWLYEIRNKEQKYVDGFSELSFYAKHFRPIIDRPTDISFAYQILSDATTKVTIDAD